MLRCARTNLGTRTHPHTYTDTRTHTITTRKICGEPEFTVSERNWLLQTLNNRDFNY